MALTSILTIGVNATAIGNNTIVAANPAQQIFLCGMVLIVTFATNGGTLTFNNQEGSFGPFIMPASGTLALDDVNSLSSPYAEFPANTGMVINVSTGAASVQLSGFIRYALG